MGRAQHIIEKMLAAHVDAPPGAGKTTLQNKLEKEFPEFKFVDADLFRDLARRQIWKDQHAKVWKEGGGSASSFAHSTEEYEAMTRKKYEAWRKRQKKPIVVFGWGHGFDFKVEDPSGRILMNVSSLKNALQLIKRAGGIDVGYLDSRRPWQAKIAKVLEIILLTTRAYVDKGEIINRPDKYTKVKPKKVAARLRKISKRLSK